MRPENSNNFDSLNIVTSYYKADLAQLMKFNVNAMTLDHIKYVAYEILKGLVFIHSKGIIHRDLKPLNILVDENFNIAISDFGQANVSTDNINNGYFLTQYVTTKYYRAPELFFKYKRNYTNKVDMWSFGCILAELFN